MKMAVTDRFMRIFVVLTGLFLVSPEVFPAFSDNEFDEKPWEEIEVQLPAFPADEDLIPFKVGSVSSMRFLIDEKSISVSSDEVIRYSVVVISASGARTISFEGLRCTTAERRVYAFGQTNGTWSKPRNGKWARVQGGSNSYPVALFSDYFCAVGQRTVMTPEDAVRVLIYGARQIEQ